MKYLKSFQRHILIATFVALLLPMPPALALEVAVTGLRNTNGDVVVCVWRQEDNGFPNCGTGQPFKKQVVPAIAPKVTFAHLPPGTYAISLFHDEKRLGKPETNFIGAPKSGIGLANNPKLGMTNRPTFDKGRIAVPETKAITIETLYLF